VAREEQQRAERGYVDRNAEAQAHAERAGGRGGGPPQMGWGTSTHGDNRPLPVSIVEGQDDFFNALKRALGITDENGRRPDDHFQALLTSQQAQTQATREILAESKATVSLLNTLVAGQVSAMQTNAQQMSQLIQFAQLGGMGGGMPGYVPPVGGGGGHGGHNTPQPFLHGGSYGSIQGNVRAGLASFINRNYGLGSAGRHNNAATTARMAQNTGIAQTLQHGGLMAAARRTPGLGIAVGTGEAINQGAEWLTNQRAKNSYYQSIYGGSNAGDFTGGMAALFNGGSSDTTSGLASRMAEEGFVLSNRFSGGGMTEDMSREAFKGVSQLGYTGDRRNQSLDFMGEQYKNLGMSIQQSLSLVQVSAKYAQGNLQGVSQQLQGVTKAAQRTGQSAAELQQAFIGNYQTALQAGAGGQAAGLAGAMTSITAGASRDLGGFSFGGMFTNPATKYAMGAQVGMTPGQIQSQAGMGNLTPQLLGAQRLTQQFMGSVLGAGLQQRLDSLMQKAGGKDKVMNSPGTMDDIALQLMSDRTWDVIAVRRALQGAGITVPDDASDQQVAKFYVSWYAGNNFAGQAKKDAETRSVKPVSDAEWNKQDIGGSGKVGGMSQFSSDYGNQLNDKYGGNTLLDAVFNSDSKQEENTGRTTLDYYQDFQNTHGHKSDPAIESLIKSFGSDPNIRVRVRSKDGKDKAVTLADAIRYYSDQLSTGSAYIISKNPDTNGKKLSELPGISTDVGVTPGKNGVGDSASESTYGDDADKWINDNDFKPESSGDDSGGGDGGGKVTVSLQPEVARLFQFQGSGVNIDTGPDARPPAITGGPK
jgi:hypothetical protein